MQREPWQMIFGVGNRCWFEEPYAGKPHDGFVRGSRQAFHALNKLKGVSRLSTRQNVYGIYMVHPCGTWGRGGNRSCGTVSGDRHGADSDRTLFQFQRGDRRLSGHCHCACVRYSRLSGDDNYLCKA